MNRVGGIRWVLMRMRYRVWMGLENVGTEVVEGKLLILRMLTYNLPTVSQ